MEEKGILARYSAWGRLLGPTHREKCLIENVWIGGNTLSRHAHPGANAGTVCHSGMVNMINNMRGQADMHGPHDE